MRRWERVAGLASRQHGLVTAEQLGELGFTRGAIRWGVASKRLVRLDRKVFRLPGSPPTWAQRAKAALLAAGPRAALSHDAAAHLLGLDGFETPPETIDVTAPGRCRKVLPDGARLHLPRRSRASFRIAGLEVTLAAQTILDLAASLAEEPLELAMDSAARRYPRLGEWLLELCQDGDGRGIRGLARLVALLARRLGQTAGSPLEVKVWRVLRELPIPEPVTQYRVRDAKGVIMRVDFAWPGKKVALHVDSFQWHGRRVTFDDDATKRNRLAALGWTSLAATSGTGEWVPALLAALDVGAG